MSGLDALFAMLSSSTRLDNALQPQADINLEESRVYNTSGPKMALEPDAVIPVVYGQSLVAPALINYYVESGEYDTLNMLLGIAEGEIQSVTQIKIGGKPIGQLFSETPQNSYNNNAEINILKGTPNQQPINGFEDIHHIQSKNSTLLYNVPYVHNMVINNAEGFGITFLMDRCISIDDENVERSWYQSVRIEYKNEFETDWHLVGIFQFTEQTNSRFKRKFQSDYFSPGQYSIRITKVSADPDSRYFGNLILYEIDELTLNSLSYPSTALMGIRIVTSESLQNITCLVRGKKIRMPNVVDGNGEIVLWEDYYYDSTLRIFRKLATGQHLIWAGDYRIEWGGNPAMCLRDFILSKRYGLGNLIAESMIVDSSFESAMLFCEEGVEGLNGKLEKRMRLDITMDMLSPADDWINTICIAMRGYIDYSQNNIRLIIEKADTPTFIFNKTNIIPGSFSIDYISEKSIPNVLNLQFANRDKDYSSNTYSLPDNEAIANGDLLKEKQQQFIGVTRTSQILREGRILLNKYKLNVTPIKFKTYIHAFTCQNGDVFLFQNDQMGWGEGGRTLDGCTDTTIKLDMVVALPLGVQYKIAIKNILTDQVEIRDVLSTNGSFSTIEVATAFSFLPEKYCEWYLYIANTHVEYRVANISRNYNGIIDVVAVNYSDDVYDYSGVVTPQENFKYITLEIPIVTNLVVEEKPSRLTDGTIDDVINVAWFKPVKSSRYIKVAEYFEIYLSDNDGKSWVNVGSTDKNDFVIQRALSIGTRYTVAVVTVTTDKEKTVPATSPQAAVVITGWQQHPQDITGFTYAFEDEIKLSWNKNTDTDLSGYEIRLVDDNWGIDDSNFVWRGKADTYTIVRPVARDNIQYFIKAYNTTGLFSNLAVSTTPQNLAPPAPSLMANGLFQKAFLMWNDSPDLDIVGYEVWHSDSESMSGIESGNEKLLIKALGTSVTVAVDYPRTYFRIRGYDTFGAGDWSNIVFADQIGLGGQDIADGAITETKISDGAIITPKIAAGAIVAAHISANVITADKLNVSCLSAISANLGCVTAGTLVGMCIKTSDDLYRTEIDRDGLRSYDASGTKLIELAGGQLKLYDILCNGYYSYLDGGSLAFHTPYESIPYVKRIQSGVACAGETVVLCRWLQPPELNLGIKRLMSYSPDKAESCQEWCVYADGIVKYDCGGSDFGYKFDVHARLAVSGGTRPECVYLDNFDVPQCTGINTCEILVKELFQLWSHAQAPAPICYGSLNYSVQYRICGSGIWCCCNYVYTQPHGTEALMKTTNIACQTIALPAGDTWEVQLHANCLSWVSSGIPSGGTTCCLCCFTYAVDCSYYTGCLLTQQGSLSKCFNISNICYILKCNSTASIWMCCGSSGYNQTYFTAPCCQFDGTKSCSYVVSDCQVQGASFSWGVWDTASKPICYFCDKTTFKNVSMSFCTPSCLSVPWNQWDPSPTIINQMDTIMFICDHWQSNPYRYCYKPSIKTVFYGSARSATTNVTTACCCSIYSPSNYCSNIMSVNSIYTGCNPNFACSGCVCLCIDAQGYFSFPYFSSAIRPAYSRSSVAMCGYGVMDVTWEACRFICYKVCCICTCLCCYWYPAPCGVGACCIYEKFYSLRDTTADECVLDPAGEISYLAVAYN